MTIDNNENIIDIFPLEWFQNNGNTYLNIYFSFIENLFYGYN